MKRNDNKQEDSQREKEIETNKELKRAINKSYNLKAFKNSIKILLVAILFCSFFIITYFLNSESFTMAD